MLLKERNIFFLVFFFLLPITHCLSPDLYADRLEPWKYRTPIKIINSTNTTLMNYRIFISFKDLGTSKLIADGKLQSDYADVRFTDVSTTTIFSHCQTSSGFYVKVTTIPALSSKIIYMYYGNPTATNTSDFFSTMKIQPDASTVGLWYFDERISTTTHDYSMYKNTGTIHGGVTWEASDCPQIGDETITISGGSALNFGGVTADYVDCGSAASLRIADKITIEAWVKPKSDLDDWYGTIVGWDNASSGYWLAWKTSGKIAFYLATSVDKWVSDAKVNFDKWNHIVATYDKDGGTNNMRIYVNGTISAQQTKTGSVESYSGNFRIGWSSSYYAKGVIDEVRISNRVLSGEEIKASYERRNIVLPEPTVKVAIGKDYVSKFTIEPRTLREGLVTLTFEFTVDMDTAAIPTVRLSFPSGAERTLTGSADSWETLREYKSTYTIISADLDVNGFGWVSLESVFTKDGTPLEYVTYLVVDTENIVPEKKEFFPNPFSPNEDGFADNTYLLLSLDNPAWVKMEIYNLQGTLVRYLVNQEINGMYRIEWDGRNDTGQIVPIGLYIYQLKIGGKLTSGTIVVSR